METLFLSLKSFVAEPFAKPMSLPRYTALVGLTILIVIVWMFVAREVAHGYETI